MIPRRVAVVGDNTIDRYLGAGGRDLIGGNALNVAVQLALAGHDVRYYGAVGPDQDGERVRSALEGVGVGLRGLETRPGATAVTEVDHTPEGDRVFVREEFGVTADYRPGDVQLDEIAVAEWVHIGMLPESRSVRAALLKRSPSLRISQDSSVSPGHDLMEVSFVSGGEAADPEAVAASVLADGARVAVVTLGAEGSFVAEGATRVRAAALPVDVVDTTGAGDSYIAGFVAARLEGAGLSEAALSGAAFAARTCGHVGGWPQD